MKKPERTKCQPRRSIAQYVPFPLWMQRAVKTGRIHLSQEEKVGVGTRDNPASYIHSIYMGKMVRTFGLVLVEKRAGLAPLLG